MKILSQVIWIIFMFDRCHHSLAVVTPAKYECDIQWFGDSSMSCDNLKGDPQPWLQVSYDQFLNILIWNMIPSTRNILQSFVSEVIIIDAS